jgi:hypothetical protein
MRIPDAGDLGNQVVRAPQGGIAVATDGGIGSAVQGVAHAVLGGAVNVLDIEKQKADQQQRANTALTLVQTQNALQDAHQETVRGLSDGSLDPTSAATSFSDAAAKIKSKAMQSVPAEVQTTLDAELTGTTGSLDRSLRGAILKRNESDTGSTISQFGDAVLKNVSTTGAKWAADKFATMVDFSGGAAGWSPELQAAHKTAFEQKATLGYFNETAANLHAAGDLDGITKALADVQGEGGKALMPDQRAQVENHLVGLRSSLEAQQARADDAAERARVARENAAADQFNAARGIVEKGQYLDAPTIAALSSATAGTTLQKQTGVLLEQQASSAGFAAMSAPQRDAQLTKYATEAANPSVGTSPVGTASLAGLQKIDSGIRDAYKDNPWKAAVTYGVTDSMPPLDLSDPGGLLVSLATRMQKAPMVEAWGGAKVSPFQPEEAAAMKQMVGSLPPAQQAATLSTIGQVVRDPQRIAAIAKQLGDKGGGEGNLGPLGLGMLYAGDQTNDGKVVAEQIAIGARMKTDKTSQADTSKASSWRGQIATAIGDAFSSENQRKAAVDAGELIMIANGGDIGPAVLAATGGIATHGQQDAKIPLPRGMDSNTFEKRVSSIQPADLASQLPDGQVLVGRTAVPVASFISSLPDATLVDAGQGRYAVKAGNSYVTNTAGQRVILGIRQ